MEECTLITLTDCMHVSDGGESRGEEDFPSLGGKRDEEQMNECGL